VIRTVLAPTESSLALLLSDAVFIWSFVA